MKILLTGCQGYIGTELYFALIKDGYEVSGVDAGYFEFANVEQIEKISFSKLDLRDIGKLRLTDFDCIIHLAALSNDPLGEIDEDLTFMINRDCAIDLARRAKNSGVARFIFASTQSIYGISNTWQELSEEAQKSPITAYARSKWDAEQEILGMSSADFTSVAVRPSTVFGWGARIRNDIVFNNMISNGLKSESIKVHSDGKPIRPVVHILDVIDFFTLLIKAPKEKISGEAFNLGMVGGNFTVLEIAKAASKELGGLPIELNTENLVDQRSYSVSFKKSQDRLGFIASRDLRFGAKEIVEKYNSLSRKNRCKFFDSTNRLDYLHSLVNSGKLNQALLWN